MLTEGGDPRAIVKERGLGRIDDPETLGPIVDRVIEGHPDEVERYKDGQEGLLGFFVGQVMRRTDGQADPHLTETLIRSRLE